LKNETSTLNPLSKSIALALSATAISPVMAQDADSDDEMMMEEVMVSGVRRSLIDATAIKRDSDGVVDAISAEDIGKFPDTNLAESLQRITGVSIDRGNELGAQGEGQRITVRGIGPDFNLVLLNGRQMPSSSLLATGPSNSRAFDFANLASEAVSGVDVYKTSMSNIPTGGIGATINIRTARPLELGEQRLSLGAKAVNDTSAQSNSWTPEVSGIYSGVFADGKFGIALSAIYQERDFGYNQASVPGGWFAWDQTPNNDWRGLPGPEEPGYDGITNPPGPNDTYSMPQQLNYSINELERERLNGQLVLQWQPVDELTLTLDYTYSELEIQQKFNDLSTWFNQIPFESTWTDGPVSSPVFYREAFTDGDVASGGGQFGNKTENNSIGFNAEWFATDRLAFALDYHSSEAESGRASPFGTNSVIGTAGFYRGETAFDMVQDFPVMSIDTPNGGVDPSQHLTTGASFRNSFMKAEVEQLDLSGVFDIGDTMSLDFGVTATEVNNHSAYNFVQYDDWGGIGSPDDFPDDTWTVRDVRSLFDAVSGSGNPNLFNEMMTWDFATVAAIREATTGQIMAASDDHDVDRRVKEDTNSAYLQYRWAFDIGSAPANLRVGVRYEDTDVTSSALVPIAQDIKWAASNEYFITYGEADFTTLEGNYDYWLPNLDFNVEFVENMIFRASYSKTIGRPGWGNIQGGQTLDRILRRDFGTAQQGDPGLLPLESKNYDLSYEWYYGEGSYFSVGYFFKDVSNYVGITEIVGTPFNLPHPGQGAWYDEANAATGGNNDQVLIRQYIFETYADSEYVEITGVNQQGNFTGTIQGQAGDPAANFKIQVPSNQQDAEIDGWEIALQHLFGGSGFGVMANYTKVDSDIAYDNASLNDQFAIEGLSDSANLIAFYDKNGWIARLAYNWRDEFLSNRFDGHGANPVYTDEYGQLDAIVSYSFENGVTLFAEGFNLTDEYLRVHGRADNQTLFVTQQGPRYGVGVRWVY
jgi:TonB-dependent receptor